MTQGERFSVVLALLGLMVTIMTLIFTAIIRAVRHTTQLDVRMTDIINEIKVISESKDKIHAEMISQMVASDQQIMRAVESEDKHLLEMIRSLSERQRFMEQYWMQLGLPKTQQGS